MLTADPPPVFAGGGFPASMKQSLHSLLPLLIAISWLGMTTSVEAKKYFTRQQAEKLCFPEADRFQWQTTYFTAEQAKAVKAAAKITKIHRGVWYGLAYQKDQIIGALVFDAVIGKHEYIDYVIALTTEGKVRQIEILEYRESWGGEVRRSGWRKQFVGKTTQSKLRLNDGIHNISGATMSCRSITDGVRKTCHVWGLVLRPALLADGRLPKLAIPPR